MGAKRTCPRLATNLGFPPNLDFTQELSGTKLSQPKVHIPEVGNGSRSEGSRLPERSLATGLIARGGTLREVCKSGVQPTELRFLGSLQRDSLPDPDRAGAAGATPPY